MKESEIYSKSMTMVLNPSIDFHHNQYTIINF